uniref:Uncharacterized protein n=1 Tax=Plectus sambesii TaxID=2011161 RepID=A0A914VCE2_9BILA
MKLQKNLFCKPYSSQLSRKTAFNCVESLQAIDLNRSNNDGDDNDTHNISGIKTTNLSYAPPNEERKLFTVPDSAQTTWVLWTFALFLLFMKFWSHRRTCLLISFFIILLVAVGARACGCELLEDLEIFPHRIGQIQGTVTVSVIREGSGCAKKAVISCYVPSGYVPYLELYDYNIAIEDPIVGKVGGKANADVRYKKAKYKLRGDEIFDSYACYYILPTTAKTATSPTATSTHITTISTAKASTPTVITTTTGCPCAVGILTSLETTSSNPARMKGTARATFDMSTDPYNCEITAIISCSVPPGLVPQLLFANDVCKLNNGKATIGPIDGVATQSIECDGNGRCRLTGGDDFNAFICFYLGCPKLESLVLRAENVPSDFGNFNMGFISVNSGTELSGGQTVTCTCEPDNFDTCQFGLCNELFTLNPICPDVYFVSNDGSPVTSLLITCNERGINTVNGKEFNQIICLSNNFAG